jgi:flagellar M-ring protein FliF
VDQLKPEDVSIIDADTDTSLGSGHNEQGSSDDEEGRLTQRLISTLEPVVGANAIRASVNVDYDQGSTEESQEKYDPSVSALLSDQKTEDQAAGGSATIGVPGTSSNIPNPKPAKPAQNTSTVTPGPTQTSKSENAQYAVNKTVTHTIVPGGRIQRVTAALLVDDEVVKTVKNGKATFTKQKRSPDELNKIRELAEAAIGFDAKRGDTISVQNMSFDPSSPDADLAPVTWTTQVQKTVSDYSSLLRPMSLLLLFMLAYVLVLRPVQKHALSSNQLAAPGVPGQPAALTAAQVQSLAAGSAETGTDVNRAAQLKEQTFDLVRKKPVDTARAMQAWMREE